MEAKQPVKVTIEAVIQAPVDKVWTCWSEPEHITKWNQASDDWHSPWSRNNLRAGGRFVTRMEAKDGSQGFDFSGVYDKVKMHEEIAYTLDDGRKVETMFTDLGESTKIVQTFEAETTFPVEYQRAGWQAILDNFKRYAEQL